MDFHPCDVPRGMEPYNLTEFTAKQQKELNSFKLQQLRKDHSYLKSHPEIKCITNTLLQVVLKARPKYEVKEFLAHYVSENRSKLEEIIEKSKSKKSESDNGSDNSDEDNICKVNLDEAIWMKELPTVLEMYKGIQEVSCANSGDIDKTVN